MLDTLWVIIILQTTVSTIKKEKEHTIKIAVLGTLRRGMGDGGRETEDIGHEKCTLVKCSIH